MPEPAAVVAAVAVPVVVDDREERFAAFVEAHAAQAHRLAWRLCGGDDQAAEEIVQDALARAYRALPRLREVDAMPAWFTRILVHRARDWRRWRGLRQRWRALWGQPAASAEEAPASTHHTDPVLRERIADALEQLTAAQREVFVLVYLEGLTLTETAEALGRAPGTVKSHLHRALRTLRRELRDLNPDDGAAP